MDCAYASARYSQKLVMSEDVGEQKEHEISIKEERIVTQTTLASSPHIPGSRGEALKVIHCRGSSYLPRITSALCNTLIDIRFVEVLCIIVPRIACRYTSSPQGQLRYIISRSSWYRSRNSPLKKTKDGR